jgi:hypothetical protein
MATSSERLSIKDDPEVLPMFHKAMKCEHGGDRKSANAIKHSNPTLDRGKAYTLTRLQKDDPGNSTTPSW